MSLYLKREDCWRVIGVRVNLVLVLFLRMVDGWTMNRQASVYTTRHSGFGFICCLFDPVCLDRVWKHILLWLLDVFSHFSTHRSVWLTACLPHPSTVASVYPRSKTCMLRYSYSGSHWTATPLASAPLRWMQNCTGLGRWQLHVEASLQQSKWLCVFARIGRVSQVGTDGWQGWWVGAHRGCLNRWGLETKRKLLGKKIKQHTSETELDVLWRAVLVHIFGF